MAVQWPLVVDRLVALLPTLPGWSEVGVFDGPAFDNVPATYCTVGHSDDGQTTRAGSFTTVQAPDGAQYVETGEVACLLVFTGYEPPNRTTSFAYMSAVDSAIRADRTLGVLSQEGYASLSVDVNTTQTVPGASLSLPFSVSYYTVT